MLGNSKTVFLALLFLGLVVLVYYLGTTMSIRTGRPMYVRANTMIQYFSLNRATKEDRSPADRSTEREKNFIEQVIANGNRTWSGENSDTETERVQSPTVRQRSFTEQVISNRSLGGKVNTERTERTGRTTSRPGDSDLLDTRSYLQQIRTALKANEAGSKTSTMPAIPTRVTERQQGFIQQVLPNKEGNEANKIKSNEPVTTHRKVPKTGSSESYRKEKILRGRAKDATKRTEIPETKRMATISVDKLNIEASSPTQVVPRTEKDAGLSTLTESLANAEGARARSQENALNKLPVQKPPQQTSSGKSKATHRKSLQPPPLLSKRLFQQRDNSPTYEEWHRQRLSNMCGDGWQEKYQQLHADILDGRQEERYLVYSCPGYRQGCCGYGNRLRALASVFYLAVLTDRAFLMDWQIPEPIDRHLVPKGIRWNYSEPLDLCSGPEFRRHYWGSTKSEIRQAQGWIIQDSGSFVKWFTSTNISSYFEYPVEKITTIWYFVEKGVHDNPFLMARAKELQVTPFLSRLPPYALIGCAFDFLFTVSDKVDRQLSSLRQKVQRPPAGPVIGIHVRTGDDQFDYYASDNDRTLNVRNLTRLLRFFECAANVERNVFGLTDQDASAVKWFVATDNPNVKTLARKRFPEKVVTSDLPILHLDILLNSTQSNSTVECHYADSTNTTMVCTDVEPFNRTIYCANRTNDTLSNSTVFNATEGIISMLVDHFLLAESDFLVLCDSSFGSTAVGLSMRESESYTFGDRGCADVHLAQRNRRLQFFKK